jgi:hypothetical protein
MKLYFDCFAGASGDMIVGALLDLGLDFAALKRALASLDLAGYELKTERVRRCEIAATRFIVEVAEPSQPARHLADICNLISDSSLSDLTRLRSILVFERLAKAEAQAHGTTPDQVHFHEVGAVDSIIDVVGAMIGFEMLNVESFISSPLRVGFGAVNSSHGALPVPAPGTAELLRGVPVYSGQIEGEFVTPTGAAIITTLCSDYGSLPPSIIDRAGYGAGSRDHSRLSNALRIFLLESDEPQQAETVMVIETNIDDMNPQGYGFVMQKAFDAGALDVFFTPAQMKKDRPATLVTVLCRPADLDSISDLLLSETTTIGVRFYEAKRQVAQRSIEEVETVYGAVRIKVARRAGRTLHFQPEFDDCAQAALQSKVSLIEVQRAAEFAYRQRMNEEED